MNTFRASLIVGLGSALGAVLRYLLSLPAIHTTWPWDTLAANTSGALAIGVVAALTAKASATPWLPAWRLFLMPGLLGGYTTFSVFSLESIMLLQDGSTMLFWLNISGNIGGALVAVWLGQATSRQLLSHQNS